MKNLLTVLITLAILPLAPAQESPVVPGPALTNAPVAKTESTTSTSPTTNTESRSRFSRSSTNSPASTNRSVATVRPTDNVRLITSKNIFDQSRAPGRIRSTTTGTQRATPRVESFGLVGTMLTSKGETAFFAGTTSSYQKSLKKGESIAGYKIDSITPKSVSLLGTNAPVEMKIGSYLRRENEGAWILSAMPEPAPLSSSNLETSSSSPATTSSSAGSAELSDVMKAMMLRREKELSK